MSEILEETVHDALRMLPVLFGAYLLLEYVEHRTANRLTRALTRSHSGPVWGALFGCVPQCGFSVAAASLYDGGLITTGTLLAVFLSTSDEALPVLLAYPGGAPLAVRLVAVKLTVGVLSGLLIDLFFKRSRMPVRKLHEDCAHTERPGGILRAALRRTGEVFFLLFAVMLALNLVLSYLGEERLASLLLTGSLLQPFVAGLLGLIPSCAASVLLSKLLFDGSLSFGAAVAGLCTSAGMGLVTLFRGNSLRESFRVTALLYLCGIAAGLVFSLPVFSL